MTAAGRVDDPALPVAPAGDDRTDAGASARGNGRGPRRSGGGRLARNWLADVIGVGAASGMVTVVVFRLWSMSLRVPFDYAGDALAQLSVTRGIVETGWNVVNPRLGAPTGYVSYDFPSGSDSLHWAGLKVLSWFSSDAVLITNLYLLTSFVTVAVVALVVLRVLGLPRWVAHPLALVFTFLPYHYERGIAHLALAAYVSVPLGALLVLWALQGRPAFFEPEGDGGLRWAPRTARSAGVLLAVVVIGVGGVYYAVFTVVLLAVASAVAAAGAGRRVGALGGSGALVIAAIAVVVVLASVPALRYQAAHGHNPGVAAREPWEVDNSPLRPIQLVTPVPHHRIDVLDRLGARLRRAPSNSEATQELGLLGSVGLALVLAALGAAAAGRRRLLGVDPGLGVLVVAAVLLGTVGGFSWVLSLAGLAEIRAWNRISVFVGFFALYALGTAVSHLVARHVRGPRALPVAVALAVALAAVGLWDQAPPEWMPSTNFVSAQWEADQRFVARLEALAPRGAMVFQLPRLSYPEEGPVNDVFPQRQLVPYLHSDSLRFSFGGMRGRESDWQEQAAPPLAAVPDFLDAISAVGFAGVLVDRAAYADRGEAIEAALATATGAAPAMDETGLLAYYDLGPYAAGYRARTGEAAAGTRAEREQARPTMWWAEGFAFQERAPDLTVSHPGAPNATSTIVNHTDRPWRGTVRFDVASYQPGPFTLHLSMAGSPAPSATVAVTDDTATPIALPVDLAPDQRLDLAWRSDAVPLALPGDPRVLALTVTGAVFTENG